MNPSLHHTNDAPRKSFSRQSGWPYSLWIFGALLTLVSVALPFIRSALADDPQITISLVSSNQLQIVITNAVPGEIYEIHRRPLFIDDPEYQWKIHLIAKPVAMKVDGDRRGHDENQQFRSVFCQEYTRYLWSIA